MSALKTRPHIDSLHTLNVWTPYGNLMAKWQEIMNGERRQFGSPDDGSGRPT
jgi:hypothetical protein